MGFNSAFKGLNRILRFTY